MPEFNSIQEARKAGSSQVHDVEVEQTVNYLEDRVEQEQVEELSRADRALLVETPDITETGIEFRFYESSNDRTPYSTLEIESSDYEVLLE